MKRNLVGVIAVSIAALLFAGCGGGSSSTSKAEESTTTTIDAAAQQLSQCAAGYAAAAEKLNAAYDVFLSNFPMGDNLAYATAVQTFNDEVSRLSCPDQVESDIRTLVEAGSVTIASAKLLASGGMPNMSDLNAANARIVAATTLIRSALNLPPVQDRF